MKMIFKTLLFVSVFAMTGMLFANKTQNIKGLEKAAGHQQKAIYHFIQAMKNVKKKIAQGKSEQGKKNMEEKNPFADKQDFKMPEMPPEKNPQVKLQKIIDMQNKIIEDLKKQKESSETASKQEEVGNAAAKLKDNHKLDDAVKKALEKAMKTSHETADLMTANTPELAKIKAQKTLSDLKDAMRKLVKASDDKFNKDLADAQKKVNDMASDGKDGKGGKDGKDGKDGDGKPREKLKSLRDKLNKKAKEQHQNGKQKNAEQLAELAKEINEKLDGKKGKGDKKTLSEKLRELQKLISKLRLQNKKDSQILADSIKKLEAYSKELKFLAKHPKSMTAAEKKELLRDIEMKMLDMMLALKALTEDGKKEKGSKNNSDSPEKLMPELKKINKDMQQQINKLKNSRGKQNAQGFAHDPLVYPEKFKKLHNSLHKIIINATLLLKNIKTEDLIYIFNTDDIPEKYRDDVAKYFERLSNSGKTKNKGNK
jgi:hypothetical protein